jgi:hypothetical protein
MARGTFANRDFVRLWCAATASNFGSMVGAIALPFTAILVLGATPAHLALLGACRLVPGFALGLFASARIERWRKRRVLVACDWARAAVLVTVPAAVWLGAPRMEHLYAVALANGLCGFLFDVAHVAYLPALVERRELLDANSRLKAAEAVRWPRGRPPRASGSGASSGAASPSRASRRSPCRSRRERPSSAPRAWSRTSSATAPR